MRYRYLKVQPKDRLGPKMPISALLPVVLMGLGLFLVGNAALPILSYQFFISPRFSGSEFIKPVAEGVNYSQTFTPVVLGEEEIMDFTQIDKWFPAAPRPEIKLSKITHYTLSIPKLKIENAVVEISGEDLKKNLVQYPGTANPGQAGNAVIFGHSVLPQFFDPKNYLAIFSTLPTLKTGDEILVNFDGIVYRYRIEEMVEVSPDDISVLEQRYDDSYITLITCVPPGLYLRRLIVRGRLSIV
jgi:sortase A